MFRLNPCTPGTLAQEASCHGHRPDGRDGTTRGRELAMSNGIAFSTIGRSFKRNEYRRFGRVLAIDLTADEAYEVARIYRRFLACASRNQRARVIRETREAHVSPAVAKVFDRVDVDLVGGSAPRLRHL